MRSWNEWPPILRAGRCPPCARWVKKEGAKATILRSWRGFSYLTELEASEQDKEESQGKEIEGLREKLAQLDEAREQARELLKQAEASPSGQVSLTDPESRLLNKKSAPGAAIVGMLGEVAVDGKEHLIAAVEVVGAGNDFGQLSPMAEAAKEVLPAPSEAASAEESKAPRLLADGGYFKIDDLAKCEEQGLKSPRSLLWR